MTHYIFPGQGSQKLGMGDHLFDQFNNYTQIASDILGYDIKELCLKDPQQHLNQTQYTQPALFTVSALQFLSKQEEKTFNPSSFAGHSLGEYTALFAAGAFDFETGVTLVKKRGELMADVSGGGMAAIIGMSAETIQSVLEDHALHAIDIANYNEPNQTVISGLSEDIKKAQPVFEKAGVRRYIHLPVSGAFHSRYMNKPQAEFSSFIKSFTFNLPSHPVIANVTAAPYTDRHSIPDLLVKQITHSVRWNDSILYLIQQSSSEFEEIGPGKVLTGLVNKIRKSLSVSH